MVATATPAAATPAAAPPDTRPEPTPTETKELVVRRLWAVVLCGRPRAALAAFDALVTLRQFHKETHGRVVELSRSGRPAVAAAAAKALLRARRAFVGHRDGRDRDQLL
jgi:hypothetical protein